MAPQERVQPLWEPLVSDFIFVEKGKRLRMGTIPKRSLYSLAPWSSQ